MATTSEIAANLNDPTLGDKVQGSLMIVASGILSEIPVPGNHAQRLAYAGAILTNPQGEKLKWVAKILALNVALPIGDIIALDAATITEQIADNFNQFV